MRRGRQLNRRLNTIGNRASVRQQCLSGKRPRTWLAHGLRELAPHAPTNQVLHNRTDEACPACGVPTKIPLAGLPGRCPGRSGRGAERRDDADVHLKRAAETGCTLQIMGRKVVVTVTDGRLDLSTWEQIFYGEFDDRRRKRVLVKVIGE